MIARPQVIRRTVPGGFNHCAQEYMPPRKIPPPLGDADA